MRSATGVTVTQELIYHVLAANMERRVKLMAKAESFFILI